MNNRLRIMRVSVLAALGLVSPHVVAQDPGTPDPPKQTPSEIPVCENPQPIVGQLIGDSGFVRCADGRVLRERAGWDLPGSPGPSCTLSKEDGFPTQCLSDSGCTDRPFGSCVQSFGQVPGCRCEYRCMSDLDCEIGHICATSAITSGGSTQCIPATCRVNQDCDSGQCEASRNRAFIGSSGSVAQACRSEADLCSTDADCPDVGCGPRCDLNTFSGHWECQRGCAVVGRPFMIENQAALADVRPGSAWIGASSEPACARPITLDDAQRQRAADHWILCARMEHASVAAFARFALQLMHLGAPPELLSATSSAMQDEIEHAKACFALAQRYGGAAQTAGPLEVSKALEQELEPARIAVDVFLEGCVGETVAALEASEMSWLTSDEQVREVLTQIAKDEHEHALLAWRSLGWMLEHLAPAQQESIRSVLYRLVEELRVELETRPPHVGLPIDTLELHGVPSEERRALLRRQAIAQVVLPCVERLLGQSAAGESRSRSVGAGALA